MNKVSVYGGTGYIGSRLKELYPDYVFIEPRNSVLPPENYHVLYMISTNNNYNVLDNPYLDVETNLTHLIKTLETIRGRNHLFSFVSSWFVYGDTTYPAKETTYCNPKGFYSITKRAAEQLVESYCKTFNIPFHIFRLANVYGLYDKSSSQRKNALHYLINRIVKNEDINLYHGGDFIRDYIYIDDVCHILMDLIGSYGLEYCNIGSGIPYNFRKLINFIFKETNSTSKIIEIEPTDFHKIVQVKDAYLDVSKMYRFGLYPKMNIYDGLKSVIQQATQ